MHPGQYVNTLILFFQTYAFVTLADAVVANCLLGNVSNALLKSSIQLYFIYLVCTCIF